MKAYISTILIALLLLGCTVRHRTPAQPFNFGDHSFPVSTKNTEFQKRFNLAMTLTYAFSHTAAEEEFRKAATLDPLSPMPWWGIALINGPHINFPLVPEDKARIAWTALKKSEGLKENGSALEKDLIAALATRYADPQPADRSKLDLQYANAMRSLATKYPDNADVLTLSAEALMDLHPWDLFDSKGIAKNWTPEIIATLRRALLVNPKHPGANHLLIHALEASHEPSEAMPSADILRTLVPSSGHLVHMPSHIYIRVGRFNDAALSNEAALKADATFNKHYIKQGFYAVYMLHDYHFLTFVRMMQGQYAAALSSARQMLENFPKEFIEQYSAVADGYQTVALDVMMRFGKWDEMLKEPQPEEQFPFARAKWRFFRATALAGLDRFEEAEKEREAFMTSYRQVPADSTFGNNKTHTLLKIALKVLDGEMAARQGRSNDAVRLLKEALIIEDTLTYDEPPDWIIPVRHTLGAALLHAGRYKEAERIYREDLKKFPQNGWSLYGLSRALQLQGKSQEAVNIKDQFQQAWKGADTVIRSSCLCQQGI